MGLFDELLKAQKPKRNLMGTQMVKGPDQPYLRQDYPGVYGALGGLLAMAPDEMAGSVLDPNTAAVRQGAEYTFPVGTALAMLPGTKPIKQGAMALGRLGEQFAERAVPQVMNRGGLLAEMMQGMSNRTVSPLDVYHGTPHKLPPTPRNPLGEFDASKIGTGEGAQSYGLGIYTAENPAVATEYMNNLAGDVNVKGSGYYPKVNGKVVYDDFEDIDIVRKIAAATEPKVGGIMGRGSRKAISSDDAIAELIAKNKLFADDPIYYPNARAKALNEIQTLRKYLGKNIEPSKPSLYKADLPDEKIAQMIDYDKPMAEQRNLIEKMREALVGPDSPLSRSEQFQINDYLSDSVRMRNLYPQSIVDLNDARIVERLRQVGIPGVKYLDEGSRAAGTTKQTRNFVSFPGEEKNLKILERNSQKASDLLASPNQSSYPQQSALDLAQQRAALPVEQGGLGLLESNTAMDRAKAMGAEDVYHGTNAEKQILNDLKFNLDADQRNVGGIWTTKDKNYASWLANQKDRNNANVMSLKLLNAKNSYEYDILQEGIKLADEIGVPIPKNPLEAQELLSGGYGWDRVVGDLLSESKSPNLKITNFNDAYHSNPNEVTTAFITKDPSLLRLSNAAFDPFRRSAAIAATMGVAAPDLLASPIDEEELRRLQSGLLYAP